MKLLKEWVDVCKADKDFVAAHVGLSFDSALAKMTVPFNDEVENTTPTPTHTLVSFRRVCLAFRGRRPVELRIANPVCAIDDTGSGCLDVALFRDPVVCELATVLKEMSNLSPQSSMIWGFDGFVGNERLFVMHDEADGKTTPMARILCMNHRNALNEVLLRAILGPSHNSQFKSLCGYIRMGSNFLRMRCALMSVLDKLVSIRVGQPPPECGEYAKAWTSYLMDHYHDIKSIFAKRRKRKQKTHRDANLGKAALQRSFDLLRERFNGAWWVTNVIEIWVPTAAAAADRNKLLQQLASSCRQTVLRATCTRPEDGKWTKNGPAYDFCGALNALHGLYDHLLAATGAGLKAIIAHGATGVTEEI